jgi:hypothetical protein
MRLLCSTVAVLCLTAAAQANPVQFDTHSYNFGLTGGGGGEAGVLSSHLSVETFCDNFNNEINVPHGDYSAYLSTLTDGSDLSNTRFGSNTSWKTITLTDGDPNDATDAAIINSADALARYQMAAFLVSLYQTSMGSTAYNNGIQGAIWDIFDPASSPAAPDYADASAALEQAAEWFANPNSDKSFLADFLIISDSTMTSASAGKPLSGGFQEQLTMIAEPVPEPRKAAWMLLCLFSVFACTRRSGLTLSSLKIPS